MMGFDSEKPDLLYRCDGILEVRLQALVLGLGSEAQGMEGKGGKESALGIKDFGKRKYVRRGTDFWAQIR
jgi:hypothetical protein